MKKPTEDTFTRVHAAVAQRVLSNPLMQYVHPTTKECLEVAAQYRGKPGRWSFLNVEFKRCGTSCQLSMGADDVYRHREHYEQDDAGNDYELMQLHAPQVNWPCHGSVDVGSAFARVEFYRDVARLGADLQSEFCDGTYWRLVRTGEERREQEEKTRDEKAKAAVRRVIDSVRSGMRAGGSPRHVNAADPDLDFIPDGAYEEQFDDFAHLYHPGLSRYQHHAVRNFRLVVARVTPDVPVAAVSRLV